MKALLTFLAITILVFPSCKKSNVEKNSSGEVIIKGSITLYVSAMHHTWGVGGINVYLKSAATFPGTDTTLYNYSAVADGGGNVEFENLFPGSYWVYATGFDHTFGMPVMGYNITPILLNSTTVADNSYYYTLYVSE